MISRSLLSLVCFRYSDDGDIFYHGPARSSSVFQLDTVVQLGLNVDNKSFDCMDRTAGRESYEFLSHTNKAGKCGSRGESTNEEKICGSWPVLTPLSN